MFAKGGEIFGPQKGTKDTKKILFFVLLVPFCGYCLGSGFAGLGLEIVFPVGAVEEDFGGEGDGVFGGDGGADVAD